jgi:hypothetical protein
VRHVPSSVELGTETRYRNAVGHASVMQDS